MQQIFYINSTDTTNINNILKNYDEAEVVTIVPIINPCGAHYTEASNPFGAYVVVDYRRG